MLGLTNYDQTATQVAIEFGKLSASNPADSRRALGGCRFLPRPAHTLEGPNARARAVLFGPSRALKDRFRVCSDHTVQSGGESRAVVASKKGPIGERRLEGAVRSNGNQGCKMLFGADRARRRRRS